MVDDKEMTRREIEVLKLEVVKDLEAFREEFQGMTESLAAAKEATQESNAKLGTEAAKCTNCTCRNLFSGCLAKSFNGTISVDVLVKELAFSRRTIQ